MKLKIIFALIISPLIAILPSCLLLLTIFNSNLLNIFIPFSLAAAFIWCIGCGIYLGMANSPKGKWFYIILGASLGLLFALILGLVISPKILPLAIILGIILSSFTGYIFYLFTRLIYMGPRISPNNAFKRDAKQHAPLN